MPLDWSYKHVVVAGLLLSLPGCALSPKPFDEVEIHSLASANLASTGFDQEPISQEIDLYEAIARALKYNLDHHVEIAEAALRFDETRLARFDLLPQLVSDSGFAERDKFNASSSVQVLPGDIAGPESLVNSTSSEKRNWTSDVSFGWNILDFGLSYIRARQASDQHLIAEEMRRKIAHRIIEDVRSAYWRAVSSDNLLAKARVLEARVKKHQKSTVEISADRQTSPIGALTFARELIDIKKNIELIQRDLIVARSQLASLMNVSPGSNFKLKQPARSNRELSPDLDPDRLISVALTNRPELIEVWYQKRINRAEVDAALLELLPGIQLLAGANYDSNEFLFNSNWLSWSAKASWNAIRLFQYPMKREVIEGQEELLRKRALAVAMAIVTQVHVSRIRFLQYKKELQTANDYLYIQTKLLDLLKEEAAADKASDQSLLREELNALLAETRRDLAYASLQNAFANIYASIGADPLPIKIAETMTVRELASSLRSAFAAFGDHSAKTIVGGLSPK